MFEVTLISDKKEGNVRKALFCPCGMVCSSQIEIELDGDVISYICFTDGCSGNTQGVAALCRGMKKDEAISRLEGINCNGRGTSCPDQLARALKMLQ